MAHPTARETRTIASRCSGASSLRRFHQERRVSNTEEPWVQRIWGRYSLKSDSHWALLGFQKSWYSDKAEVRFTVNLLVVRRDVWSDLVVAHPYYGATPSAITLYGPPVRSTRIGKLVDDHEDKWWRVYAGQNMGMLRADVIANVVDAGLPWLREQIASTEQGRA